MPEIGTSSSMSGDWKRRTVHPNAACGLFGSCSPYRANARLYTVGEGGNAGGGGVTPATHI